MDITRRTLIGAGAAVAAGTATTTLMPAGASALLPAGDGAATAWRLARHDNARTANVVETTLSAANVGRLRLRQTIYLGDNQHDPHDPTVDGDTLMVGADSAMVIRYRTPGMSTVWRRTLWPAGERMGTSTAIGAERIIAGGYNMSALDRSTGRILWSVRAPDYEDYTLGPALTATAVYGLTTGGVLSAFAPTTGAIRWTTLAEAWHDASLGGTAGPPAFLGGRLYLAAEKLACIDARNGAVLWSTALPDYARASAVVSGTRVLVPEGGGVTAVSAATGRRLWRAAIRQTEALAVAGTRIYAWSSTGLRALDAATGRVIWRATAGLGKPVDVGVTHANGVLYFKDDLHANRLVAADARNGTVLWSGPDRYTAGSDVVVSGGAVYVPTYERSLLKFGL